MEINKKILTENQLIRIVEERGVAVSPWKKEIDKIALYIRRYVLSVMPINRNFDDIEFDVPPEICNVFPFLGDLSIHVISKHYNSNSYSGGGSFGPKGSVTYSEELRQWIEGDYFTYSNTSQKLHHGDIEIFCYYNDVGKVWLNSVLQTLYHELNHAYDAWINMYKNKNLGRYTKSGVKGILGNEISEKYPYIGECIYRLFSETEYNALVASVFGDLQGRQSELKTFQQDYKNTKAYRIYVMLKNNLQNEINNLTVEEAKDILNDMKAHNISLNLRRNSFTGFKNAFIHKANIKLNNLLYDIGRVASLYYEKQYDEKIKNNTPDFEIID